LALILFSTTDVAGPRQADFARMLRSVARNAAGPQAVRCHVLLQNCSLEELAALRNTAPACCHLTAIEGRCSLSAARNRLIEAVRHEAFGPDDVVFFPDDDCWLPDHLAGSLATTFTALLQLDLLICRVTPAPVMRAFSAADVRPAATWQIVRIASSNGMFIRASVFRDLGRFDPSLGVGTANGGAEDTDFVIRAFLAARQSGILDRTVVAHSEPDRDSAAKYYRGSLIVLARHAARSPALLWEFLRKLLVGGYFTLCGKLRLRALLSAFAAATRSLAAGARAAKPDWRGETAP
jgi:hypothetical protein